MKEEKKTIITYMKRADKGVNKIIIPKAVIEKFGNEFLMSVNYETGEMKLMPISKIKEGDE